MGSSAGRVVSVALLPLLLVACGGGGVGGPIASHTLGGMVGGKPWSFVSGETNAFLSTTDHFFTELYDLPAATRCSGRQPDGSLRQLILSIPNLPGSYPLGIGLTATFSYDDGSGTYQNEVAFQGLIEVAAISSTEIVGAARMYVSAANSVEGQFTVDVCPP